MATTWNSKSIALDFDSYDDILEQTLGYPFVYGWLPLHNQNCKTLLDYGCGPGKVSYSLAHNYGKQIIAVDESSEMLTIAMDKRSHSSIQYHLIEKDSLSFLKDNSLDGAILCFVLLNLSSEPRIVEILTEINRVLKPEAPCIILETNPEAIGIKFATFQSGKPNFAYSHGQERKAWLYLPEGKVVPLNGYYWPKSMYYEALEASGFCRVEENSPILKILEPKMLDNFQKKYANCRTLNEWTTAPFILFRGLKK